MHTIKILDKSKEKLGLSSDYQLAKFLNVRGARIGDYRTGRRKPDDEMCFRLADILGEEPAAIIAIVRLDEEQEPEKVEFWKSKAKKYAASAGIIAALLAGTPAQAQTHENAYYVKSYTGLNYLNSCQRQEYSHGRTIQTLGWLDS